MSRLPDIPALSSAEVVLPTLAMNSSELGDISLSGLINTIITPDNQGHVLDPAMQVRTGILKLQTNLRDV